MKGLVLSAFIAVSIFNILRFFIFIFGKSIYKTVVILLNIFFDYFLYLRIFLIILAVRTN